MRRDSYSITQATKWSSSHLVIPRSMRRHTTTSQIMHWNQNRSRNFPTIHDNTGRYIHDNTANYALRLSGTAFSILLRLNVHRQLSHVFQAPRCYRLMIISTPIIIHREIYSKIHALRLPLRTNALRSLHYPSSGTSFKLYHLFSYRAPSLIVCLL